METKDNPTRIGKLLTEITFDRCERCNCRIKARDEKYCERCVKIWHRRQEPVIIAREFHELVGAKYIDAKMEDIEQPYKDLLLLSEITTQDVFLWGNIGVGKTYAMAALIGHYLMEGYSCERINFDEFCSKVRSSMNNNSGLTEYQLVNSLVEVDKLFIDDIGLRSKQETDFAYITLYSILNKRQEQLLPVLISTNKSIEQLASSFDNRIASRLGTAININMVGKDRRLTGKSKRSG